MDIKSVTVIIVTETGRMLLVQPSIHTVTDVQFDRREHLREVPSGGPFIQRKFSRHGTFTLRIDGKRETVNGTWIDTTEAPAALLAAALEIVKGGVHNGPATG